MVLDDTDGALARSRSFGKCTFRWEARLIPNPIHRVLSSIQKHRVRALLMGGQACVLYGGAESKQALDFSGRIQIGT